MKLAMHVVMPGALALGLLATAVAQTRNSSPVVVTAVPKHGVDPEPIGLSAITVQQNGKEDKVRGWQAVNNQTAVDLAIMIDEDTQHINVQLNDVRNFVKQLPPNVRVGVGYFSAGAVQFAQSAFTPDRNLILLKLQVPSGAAGSSPSPFGSVQFLMQRWRSRPGQVHEMLMISDGIEHLGGNNGNNITLKKAVADTVQAGVVVYAIAASDTPSAGSPPPLGGFFPGGNGAGPNIVASPSSASDSQGVMNMGELTEATGGMTYAGNGGTAPRFTNFLDDLLERLQHQYLLAFDSANAKPGLDSVKIDIRAADEKVTVPHQVFVGN